MNKTTHKSADLLGQLLFTFAGGMLLSIPSFFVGMQWGANATVRWGGLPGYEGGGLLGGVIGFGIGTMFGELLATRKRPVNRILVMIVSVILTLLTVLIGFWMQEPSPWFNITDLALLVAPIITANFIQTKKA